MKNELKNAIAIAFASIFLALIASAVGTLFYMMVLEKPYLSYENLPLPTVLASVKPGEIMPLRVVRCNSDDVPHSYPLSHSLYNLDTGVYTLLQGFSVMISPGCDDAVSRLNRMPIDLPPGHYQLFGAAEIRGTIRTFVVDWHSEPFKVEVAK